MTKPKFLRPEWRNLCWVGKKGDNHTAPYCLHGDCVNQWGVHP